MPESYGLGDPSHGFEPMTWEWLVGKMTGARSYWVATARSDGPPHVVPVWGVWVDGRFWFFTDRRSLKARNAERDPRATVNLESGDEVVILEGGLVAVTETSASRRVSAAFEAKYSVSATLDDVTTLFYLSHRKVLAWLERDFPRTATRWRF